MSTTPTPWIRDVREADFEREVLQASRERPVVVDFWAPWCGPCRALGPLLERLVAERNGAVHLAKVNVDEAPELAGQFGVSSIPAVKAFRNGRIVNEFTGLLPESYLSAFLDEISPSESDRLVSEARAREANDPAKAEELYRQVLGQRRNDEEARLGLARVLLAQDRLDEIQDLIEPLGSEGEVGAEAQQIAAQAFLRRTCRDLPEESALRKKMTAEPKNAAVRYELGCVLARKGDYPSALALLLEAGELDPKLAAGKVRETMVQVFYALGANHPLANDYRARLSRLLY